MKFDEYLHGESEHPEIDATPFPALAEFQNLILFGPAGAGKYTQALRIVRRYSSHQLKYEKKVTVVVNDAPYTVRISDVHYEVDMATLGCTPKVLWHEIHAQIIEIIQCKFPERHGIVVCKNFQAVDSELLEIFYSYMQDSLRYILITESVSFLPTNIASRCRVVPVPKRTTRVSPPDSVKFLCDKVIDALRDKKSISAVREELYAILVYDVDVESCIWYFVSRALRALSPKERHEQLQHVATTMRYFTTNYRPIYHLESIVFRFSGMF